MIKQIKLKNNVISYDMQYKNVKNINLRIKSDGTICVSASCFVGQDRIDDFLRSKVDLILKTIEKLHQNNSKERICYVSEGNIQFVILDFCRKLYPYFQSKGIEFPEIKFKRMTSQWGNCRPQKGILTFNTNLMYVPAKCIEYVVAHEFTHFLQANHSTLFYSELEKVIPDWKERREILKEIIF